MQIYNNILAVEPAWLVDNNFISLSMYKQLVARQQVVVLRRACRGTSALIKYESLPLRYREAIEAQVGSPYLLLEQNSLIIEDNSELSSYFENWQQDGKYLPAAKVRQYYTEAIILEAIRAAKIDFEGSRRDRSNNKAKFWQTMVENLAKLDADNYPHELPSNARSLERKYLSYCQEGAGSLIHKSYKTGNINASKVESEEQKAFLIVLLSDPRNLDNTRVAELYNVAAAQNGWKTITASAVAVWRKNNLATIYARRHGSKAFNNKLSMQVQRSAPVAPLAFWTLDGWDAELLYQKDVNGVTKYHHRLTVVVVLDAFKKYPIGYAIGEQESTSLITKAVRNAVNHTRELFGKRYKVAQIQSDNYGIKAMTPIYEQVARYVTPAQVGNAKAKIIEPWFNYFNKKYCQLQPNWSGHNVTAKKESQPNIELLQKYRKDYPDAVGVTAQLTNFLELERQELQAAYVAEFGKSQKVELSDVEYLKIFGERSNQTTLKGNGLTVSIGGIKTIFDCFDLNFRKFALESWQVCYDPDDLSTALAITADGRQQFLLEEKYRQPMALIERKAGDSEQLARVHQYNKDLRDKVADELSTAQDLASSIFEKNKELSTLQKFLITDSRGQHKNERNAERLKELDEHKDDDSLNNFYDMY